MSTQKFNTPGAKRSRNQKGKDRSSKPHAAGGRSRRSASLLRDRERKHACVPAQAAEIQRRGDGHDVQRTVMAFIERNFTVPGDFERSHKFGPLSGMCFEERLIAAIRKRAVGARLPTGIAELRYAPQAQPYAALPRN